LYQTSRLAQAAELDPAIGVGWGFDALANRGAVWKPAHLARERQRRGSRLVAVRRVDRDRYPEDEVQALQKRWGLVAEDADAYLPMPPSAHREIRPEIVLLHRVRGGPWSDLASRVRFETATVDSTIAATRGWFGERLVDQFRWLIGPSATPKGIAGLLLASGARRDEHEPELAAMVLDQEPPTVPGITVRRVASLPDFERMEAIRQEVFGSSDAEATDRPADRRARWAEFQATAGTVAFLAELEGAAVSYGLMSRTELGPMLLAGGVTLPQARGRGAYRALVRARWEAARQTGVPVLVTQAQAASRPILKRLGFRATATIEVLIDRP